MRSGKLMHVAVEQPLIAYPELFRRQVLLTPNAIAVEFEGHRYTYRQLDADAQRIADRLLAHGCQREQFVGLCLGKSYKAIAAMLGVLYAGAAFVPLDPDFPPERLSFCIDDANIRLILSDCPSREANVPLVRACQSAATEPHLLTISPDEPSSTKGRDVLLGRMMEISPSQAAYVMYTSGSTGKPKGVVIEHAALAAYCFADIDVYRLLATDRTLQFSTLTFDISIEEIFPPLLTGSAVVVRPRTRSASHNEMSTILHAYRITAVHLATAYWHEWVDLMVARNERVPQSLRLMVVTGEKVSAEHYRRWLRLCDHSVLWCNAYGPTEATVSATVFIPPAGWSGDPLPIGKPLKRYTALVLDSRLQPVLHGDIGELYLGGPGLARGYLNRPELTDSAFVLDPSDAQRQRRLYKTGDLARWLPDGDLEFAGRIDHQIKMGSFRIEPGEIEAVLDQYPGVNQSLVVGEQVDNQKCLIAYVAHGAQTVSAAQLTAHCRERLPAYMIPARYVLLDEFPKTINGKIDRKALPSPDAGVVAREYQLAAPRTDLERDLVRIWCQVLNLPEIGIHDDFFALGGSSLLVTRVIAQIGHRFDAEIPVRDFFANPTIAQIADQLEELAGGFASVSAVAEDPKSARERLQLPKVEAFYFSANAPITEMAVGGSSTDHESATDDRLFAVHYHPVGHHTKHAVVLCPSIGHEYHRAHRNLQQLALLLARQGLHVLRFDYSGTGNSSGDDVDADPQRWQQEILAAARLFRSRTGADRLSAVGIRCGATMLALLSDHPFDTLVYWDPVRDGHEFCRMLTRFHQTSLKDLSRFQVVRRGRLVDQAYGLRLTPATRSGLNALRFPPHRTSQRSVTARSNRALVVQSKSWRSRRMHTVVSPTRKPVQEPAHVVEWHTTNDEIHWDRAEFTECAFSSPAAFRTIVDELTKPESTF